MEITHAGFAVGVRGRISVGQKKKRSTGLVQRQKNEDGGERGLVHNLLGAGGGKN